MSCPESSSCVFKIAVIAQSRADVGGRFRITLESQRQKGSHYPSYHTFQVKVDNVRVSCSLALGEKSSFRGALLLVMCPTMWPHLTGHLDTKKNCKR